ncbi:DUF1993 domain-containing protein [Variovorax sp. WS11]|uniref:DUF1993 domain-containing protein n=1 Tax=Variovorax sp. WS11 TaxID=1105204 RepID=UPI000D0D2E66|nr:DUF1993 domain-containing protein [Variovorax sp. WS11]NDZ16363.1 DUF1993 domain-containing protein [Variovorax sp. WS11]PSL82126.1 DUF1993 domain-containing protein [Variovorax sp. WS11]
MALSFYDISVPVFLRGLGQLSHLLDKGIAHAQASGLDPAVLVDARLAPDMFTLAGQIQSASDASKLGTARIAGLTAPSFPDTETTYAELQARVAKTVDYLQSVDRALIDGFEDRPVTMKARGNELTFTAQRYLLQFALPNFFFHVTTAYDVLRHSGVPLGKMDYLGRF